MYAELNSQLAPPGCEISETRDRMLVHRAFEAMTPQARKFLWNWLEIDSRFESQEVPEAATATGQEFLWYELLHTANVNGRPFYIVHESKEGETDQIFVSSDFVSANNFARNRAEQRLRSAVDAGRRDARAGRVI
jgi:hypothetical protein